MPLPEHDVTISTETLSIDGIDLSRNTSRDGFRVEIRGGIAFIDLKLAVPAAKVDLKLEGFDIEAGTGYTIATLGSPR